MLAAKFIQLTLVVLFQGDDLDLSIDLLLFPVSVLKLERLVELLSLFEVSHELLNLESRQNHEVA